MEYKGYSAHVEFDSEAGVLHGEVANISDVVTFQATSVEELKQEFKTSVNDYLEYCAQQGREPARPYSGRFVVRMPPDLHRAVAEAARRQGQSLNRWVVSACEERLDHEGRSVRGGSRDHDSTTRVV